MENPISVRLRELRTRAGLTQQDLAVRAGLHAMTIARFERGHIPPNLGLNTASKIARALGVSLYELIGEDAASNP